MANGSREWRINGRRHRIDGPAVERSYGRARARSWYIFGKFCTRTVVELAVATIQRRMAVFDRVNRHLIWDLSMIVAQYT